MCNAGLAAKQTLQSDAILRSHPKGSASHELLFPCGVKEEAPMGVTRSFTKDTTKALIAGLLQEAPLTLDGIVRLSQRYQRY